MFCFEDESAHDFSMIQNLLSDCQTTGLKDQAEDAADSAAVPAESGEPVANTVSKGSGPEKSDAADSGDARVAVRRAHERELEDVSAEGLAETSQAKKTESKAVVRPKAKTEPKKLMTAAKAAVRPKATTEPKKLMTAAKAKATKGAGPKATCKAKAKTKRKYEKNMTMEEMEKQLHSVAASFHQEQIDCQQGDDGCLDVDFFPFQSLHCMI